MNRLADLATRIIKELRTVYYLPTEAVERERCGEIFARVVPVDKKIIFVIHPDNEQELLQEAENRHLHTNKINMLDFLELVGNLTYEN